MDDEWYSTTGGERGEISDGRRDDEKANKWLYQLSVPSAIRYKYQVLLVPRCKSLPRTVVAVPCTPLPACCLPL